MLKEIKIVLNQNGSIYETSGFDESDTEYFGAQVIAIYDIQYQCNN